MAKEKIWILPDISTEDALRMSKELKISLLAAKVLCARNFDCTTAKKFLNTNEESFYNPFLLNDMHKAVNRIKTAVDNKEKIAVYGDYDVDGITATFILYDYLKSIGADVLYYIPDRIAEGYGMNISAIDYLSEKKVNLIITVDVGITAFTEALYVKENGMDLIITDHHSLKDSLPEAVAVINPKITSADYPFDALAGVGVAFKLIYALSGLDKEVFNKYCDIAAIGTIADMVSLKDENRYIASVGIKKLRSTENMGLKAIMQQAGLSNDDLSSSDISFGIAPRLNAAGRMSDASISVSLLSESNYNLASKKAELLDDYNQKRQKEEQAIFEEAIKIIESNSYHKNNFILVAKEGWANGVIGIVSSKLTEKYYRPSAVISINEDGTGKASGRSIKGINLFDILCKCSDNLVRFGGHELAAGFTVKEGYIEKFRKDINSTLEPIMTKEILSPCLDIDCSIDLGDVTIENAHSLEVFEPYGIDNNVPIFCIYNLRITGIRYTQNRKHAFITVTDDIFTREFPAFSMSDRIKPFSIGEFINIAGTIGINTFRGKTNSQFIIRDIQSSELNKYVTRSELACIFSDIRNKIIRGINLFDKKVKLNISQNKKIGISHPKVQTALKIFDELLILKVEDTSEGFVIKENINFKSKTNLIDSETYKNHTFDIL